MWYRYSKIIIAGRADDLIGSFLKNDPQKISDIKQIDVDDKLKPKIYPVLAFFYAKGENLNSIQYLAKNLNDVLMKYPHKLDVSTKGTKIQINREKEQHFDDFLKFSEYIDAIHSNMPGEKPQQTSDVGFEPGRIYVVKINNALDAFIHGNDQSWCISKWGSGMWQSYRDQQASTYYFVFDGTRSEDDPLRKVAVDMTENGVLMTDKENSTGTIAEFGSNHNSYFNYLQSKGVDTRQFVNDPLTPKEKEESRILGPKTNDFNKFRSWNANYKSKYIGRGHILTDEQFNHILGLYENRINTQLAEQYVSTGIPLPEEQIEIIKNYKGLFNTYNSRMGKLIDQMKDKLNQLDDAPNTFNNHFIGIMQQKNISPFGVFDRYEPQRTLELINMGTQWNPEMVEKYSLLWFDRLTPKLIQQIGINPNDLLGKWDYDSPQRTLDLINLGAQWNPEMAKKYDGYWSSSLTPKLIQQLRINPNDLLGKLDKYDPQRTFELINMGAQWNPEMAEKYHIDWLHELTPELIQQLRINPNYLLGKWDKYEPQRTLELINMGTQWNPEMVEKYSLLWFDRLTPKLIQQIGINPNDLLGKWDYDSPQRTLDLINLGVQWNPEMVKKYGRLWFYKLAPELIQQIRINPNDILGEWDQSDPQKTLDLINMGAQWNPEMIKGYYWNWHKNLTPEQADILGISQK